MQIRAAIAADAAEIARVHVATWQAAYRGQIPDCILDALDIQRRTAMWQRVLPQPNGCTFVAELQNAIIGFCNLIPSRDHDADCQTTAEIAAVYVLPEHWRRKIGQSLCERAFQEAKQRGFNNITMWVLKTNFPAIQFYQSVGFVPDEKTKAEQLSDFTLHEIRLALTL